MKQRIDIDASHSIEYDNSHILSRGNFANIYCGAQLVEHTPKKKHIGIFICGAKNKQDEVLDDDIIIKVSNLKSSSTHSSEDEIDNEIELLLELDNEPNIVHIKKYSTNRVFKRHKFIGLECCRGGDLFNYFTKNNLCMVINLKSQSKLVCDKIFYINLN